MSSIRLFVLGALDERGPMHGHALRLLAEEEHIDLWTDFAGGAIYGAIKRLAAEGLIDEERVERQGNYPERQVYRITEKGSRDLEALRREGLTEIVIKPDPFDLALARLDPERLAELPGIIAERLGRLSSTHDADEKHLAAISKYLTVAETWSMRHRLARWQAEAEWHDTLLAALPQIITDEKQRQSTKGQDK